MASNGNVFVTGLERVFAVVARHPPTTLTGILGVQTLLHLSSRELWYSDEIRYANAFEQMMQAKKWLVLYLNGVPYPDKPPVYFWFLAILHWIMGHMRPSLFFLGAALSGLFFLWSIAAAQEGTVPRHEDPGPGPKCWTVSRLCGRLPSRQGENYCHSRCGSPKRPG
jgi:hypothetical protein